MARPATKVSANTIRSILARYGKGDGLVKIAKALTLGVAVVRRVLVASHITIRGRGRPRTA